MDIQAIEKAIARVKSGQAEAFRDIVRETASLVRGYVGYFVMDKECIDDVAQEVYIEVFNQLSKYEAGTDFVAWVKAIARNAALAERRRRDRKMQAHQKFVLHVKSSLETRVCELEKEFPVEEQLERLQDCLAKLPERMKAVVNLRYVQKFSTSKVAETAQMNTGAVLTTLHRARSALSRCMKAGVAQ